MCEIRPQKDFGPIMLSLRKESVTMCHFGPDLSPFLRGDVYILFFGSSNCKIRRLFAKKRGLFTSNIKEN